MTDIIKYTGDLQPNSNDKDQRGRPLKPYLPSDELIEAVNLAIYLNRPLLLRGEPGCGKTRLAEVVAFVLGLDYESWHVKSTDRAVDGLYRYDAMGRLHDSQLAIQEKRQPKQPAAFIDKGPLGKAFEADRRTVVLIDEIDKADMDFPNDLLEALDELSFTVRETGQTITAKHPPIVFITSNAEKELPPAFLRRCLFHYIEFPSPDKLEKIIRAHFSGTTDDLVKRAVEKFMGLRERMDNAIGGSAKKVSTSELLDWFKVLIKDGDEYAKKLLEQENMAYQSTLIKRLEDLPKKSP